jgi:putative DNA primase/helicase
MTQAQLITLALRGDWSGSYGLAPGPAHSPRDRSMLITDRNDGEGIVVHSFAGDHWQLCRDHIAQRGLVSAHSQVSEQGPSDREHHQRITEQQYSAPLREGTNRSQSALGVWRRAGPAAGSLAEQYLVTRGITLPLPLSVRYAPSLRHTPTGLELPAMVAAIQSSADQITGIHRTFLKSDGSGKATIESPKMALGPIGDGAVRLSPAGETLVLVEGIEDGLALIQMTGQPAWALLGTSNFKNFIPPSGTKNLILAPDADAAGDSIVADTAKRLAGLDTKVMHLRPPNGADWCDVLADFEERASVVEYDGGLDRPNAETRAFCELISSEIRDGR